jgi:DNA replication protein DnaC
MPSLSIGSELLFEVFSQRYERCATMVTSNLPFEERTSVFGSECLTGAFLDRLTQHVRILEMYGKWSAPPEADRLSTRACRQLADSQIDE